MLDALQAGDGSGLRAVLEKHLRNKCAAVLDQWPDIERQLGDAGAEEYAKVALA